MLKQLLIYFVTAGLGAFLSTTLAQGKIVSRLESLEKKDTELAQVDDKTNTELTRLDREGSQKVIAQGLELKRLQDQYDRIENRQLAQIEGLAAIKAVLERIERQNSR